jgi:hypothetical protein
MVKTGVDEIVPFIQSLARDFAGGWKSRGPEIVTPSGDGLTIDSSGAYPVAPDAFQVI